MQGEEIRLKRGKETANKWRYDADEKGVGPVDDIYLPKWWLKQHGDPQEITITLSIVGRCQVSKAKRLWAVNTCNQAARVRLLKDGLTAEQIASFKARNPEYTLFEAVEPSRSSLEKQATGETLSWAVDGCGGLEPDGYCRHGMPAWPRALGWM